MRIVLILRVNHISPLERDGYGILRPNCSAAYSHHPHLISTEEAGTQFTNKSFKVVFSVPDCCQLTKRNSQVMWQFLQKKTESK